MAAIFAARRRLLAGICVAAALGAILPAPAGAQEVAGRSAVAGAGSTFAYPVVAQWSKGYRRWIAGGGDIPIASGGLDDPPTAPVLDYEPIGSLGGIMRVKDGAVDFAASEMPIAPDELHRLGLVQFPILIGGIVAVVNIDGVGPGQLKLTGPLLADIFLGKVRRWADPALVAANPGLALPDADIRVVRRADGSGTTYNFTDYLSKVSPEWRSRVGADLLVKWPTGIGAKGNDGVSQEVRRTRNAIGYVEFGHALQTRLAYATLQNRAGAFVRPAPAAFQAGAAPADWGAAADFHLMLTDTPGADAYPIVATVFALMPRALPPARARAAVKFFGWSLDKGAKEASDLGYVPLPPALVALVRGYWVRNVATGS